MPDNSDSLTDDISSTPESPGITDLLHQELKSEKLYRTYHLHYDSSFSTNFYSGKTACEAARKSCIRSVYDKAAQYLTPGTDSSMASDAAHYYSRHIQDSALPFLDILTAYCTRTHQTSLAEEFTRLVKNSYQALLSAFEEELTLSSYYYQLYSFDYFLDQIEIERHDFRIRKCGIRGLLEAALGDTVQYSLLNVYSPVKELEQDLNAHASTFFGAAYSEYMSYAQDLERILDTITKGLPPVNETERIYDYLLRMYEEEPSS